MIVLMTPSLIDGDAVSNDVKGMRDALTAAGHEVQIFAQNWRGSGPPPRSIRDYRPADFTADSWTILHFSVGWRPGLEALRSAPGRKAIKYHNITPPEFFAGINDDYVITCRQGRAQLGDLAKIDCDVFLSDSHYNQQELIDAGAGAERSRVVPPFHQVNLLHEAAEDAATLERYRDGRTNILTVGRVAPNKGHLFALEAFARYQRDYDCRSRLFIVGSDDPMLLPYTEAIRQKIRDLHLESSVIITGKVRLEELKAYYGLADLFLVTSDHEGFCVPIVEAMSLTIPVVALEKTAVGETVGSGGVAWPEADPALFAETFHHIVRDPSLGQRLGRTGLAHYESHFTNRVIARRLQECLAE